MDSSALLTQATSKLFHVEQFDAIHHLRGADWIEPKWHALKILMKVDSHIWSYLEGDRLIGLVGVTDFQPWACDVWSFLTDELKAHPFFLHRASIHIRHELRHYRRVQCRVSSLDHKAVAWIQRLGFTRESVMPLAGKDMEAVYHYVWFPRGMS